MLYSKHDGWKLLLDVISNAAYNTLITKFSEAASWTIVEYSTRSGTEIGFWIFKREPGADLVRSSGGIMISGVDLYHIVRSNTGIWSARLISLHE